MQNDWRVAIQYIPGRVSLALYIYRLVADGKTEVMQGSDRIVTFTKGEVQSPTLVLQQEMLPALMKALSDYGVKRPDESFVEGKLSATEKHLEDMRSLIFKNKKDGNNTTERSQ